MSIPAEFGGTLNLEVQIPAIATGKCGCLAWRRVRYDGVVYDPQEGKLVARQPAHMTEEEKKRTREVLSHFIHQRTDNDAFAFTIICKFIEFDPDKSATLKIRQVEKLKALLEAADKGANDLRISTERALTAQHRADGSTL